MKGPPPYPAALERLRGQLHWFPVPLTWNTETISVGDAARFAARKAKPLRSPGKIYDDPGDEVTRGWIPLNLPDGFTGWVALSDAEPGYASRPGKTLLTGETSSPGLFRRVDGLSYRAERQLVLPGAVAVLDGPWSLDLSYQGVSPHAREDELRSQAHQELVRAGRDEVLHGPLSGPRTALISALLPHLDEEDRDFLHGRILQAADDVPQEFRFDPFAEKRPELSPWDKLVEQASLSIRLRRGPGFEKASRILTHPCHVDGLYSRSWEGLAQLAGDAYSKEDERYLGFLVYVWVAFDNVKPPLTEVPALLRSLPSGRGLHYNWGHYVRNRLAQLGTAHKDQLPWLCQEWQDSLPSEGYDKVRQWCRKPTP